jgi:hypothetical protein
MGADYTGSGSGPIVPACPGIGPAGYGHVGIEVTLTRGVGSWRVRSGSADAGDFEIMLQRGTGSGTTPFGVSVSGLIRGLAINTSALFQPVGESRVSFAGSSPDAAAQLDGTVTPDGMIATGSVIGTVVFSNSSGSSTSCNSGTVHWSLSRLGQLF